MIRVPETYAGMQILIDEKLDREPRMMVSPEFAKLMPAEFVADLNAWMVEFFGTQRSVYRVRSHTVVMGPRSYEILKRMPR